MSEDQASAPLHAFGCHVWLWGAATEAPVVLPFFTSLGGDESRKGERVQVRAEPDFMWQMAVAWHAQPTLRAQNRWVFGACSDSVKGWRESIFPLCSWHVQMSLV